MKSGFEPERTNANLERYLDLTKMELSSIEAQKFRDNLNKSERNAIKSLQSRQDPVIKKSDKSNSCVIMSKQNYISEANRQLGTKYYTEIKDFDLSHLENSIKEKLVEMKNNGSIDSTTFKFLNEKKIATRIGRFYLLPKIHKLENCTVDKIKYEGYCDANIIPVSRPIISQIGTATENIAHYVDHFLLPVVNVQTTYIRDSSYFINKVERLRPHAYCLLVSFDISSMYTNVQFDELLTAIESAYEAFDKTIYEITAPPTQDILDLVKLILENNVFEFNSKTYKQTIGCAMGVRCSPSICDIRIFEVINQITMKFDNKEKIFYLGRYRDDGFMIYHGNESEIHNFFEIANSHHPLLKFTYEISNTNMNFLDTTVYKGSRFAQYGIRDFKSHIKPTNSFQYLERKSAHNPSVFKAFIKGETIRHLRNTSDEKHFTDTINDFKLHLT